MIAIDVSAGVIRRDGFAAAAAPAVDARANAIKIGASNLMPKVCQRNLRVAAGRETRTP